MQNIFLLLTCPLFTAMAHGQAVSRADDAPERREGELLLQLTGDADIDGTLAAINRENNFQLELRSSPAPGWRIYAVNFEERDAAQAAAVLRAVQRAPGVRSAQWNYRAEERALPNDTEWNRQEDMRLINATQAWALTTGGLTPRGDTIVVAVLEKGLMRMHPDLVPNLWRNHREIPDNKIDDDKNGFIDDYWGLDTRFPGSLLGNGSSHGTSVTGIIGARGNNNIGVTGINWNVKMMVLTNVEFEDEIIAGYYYVAEWRKRYNATNGREGAFVVATNASFGLDFKKAENHPLWCAVYDSLGRRGVLNIASTTNRDIDVDVQGDMPTTCTSEFLLTTTSVVVSTDQRSAAGYGSKSIDMGAPGTGTYTTINGGTTGAYGSFGGTSAAAPHITGTVGLLYSLGCPSLTENALTAPAETVRRMRDLILQNTAPNPSLRSITVTGGRLDLNRTFGAVQERCGSGVQGPLNIVSLIPNPVHNAIDVQVQTPGFGAYQYKVYDVLGRIIVEKEMDIQPFRTTRLEVVVENWPAGTYFLSFGVGKEFVTKKFIKI
jgi:Subtilase family/Secretion system C-terminal sorting domain